MNKKPVRVSVPEELAGEIEAIAQQTQRSLAAVVREMLAEDLKMRRVRGIYFADEFERREPKVGGSGLGVWEVIAGYKRAAGEWERYKAEFEWLDEFQLRMALDYYTAYPDEIDAAIAENENFSIEEFWAKYPATKPPWAARSDKHPDVAKA